MRFAENLHPLLSRAINGGVSRTVRSSIFEAERTAPVATPTAAQSGV